MIFCSASGSPVEAATVASVETAGTSRAGAGVGGAATGPGVRRREIGGRTAARFTAPSPSGRFGFGFFSSINDTLSTFRAPIAFGFVSSAGLTGDSVGGFAAGAMAFGFAGVSATEGFETFAGAGVFAAFGSLASSFAFGADGAAVALAGLRGLAALRATVDFVVVFVAIKRFKNFHHGRFTNKPAPTVLRVSPDEQRRGFPSPSLRPPKESPPNLRPPRRAILPNS